MRALLWDGSEPGLANLDFQRQILARQLRQAGWQVTQRILSRIEIEPCCGAFACWVRTPGECALSDNCRQIAEEAITHDLLVFLTPLVFGGYSYQLKKALDHLISNVSPYMTLQQGETRHLRRYDGYPSLLVVGVQPRPDPAAGQLFERLAARNALNLHTPAYTCLVLDGELPADEQSRRLAACLLEIEVPS